MENHNDKTKEASKDYDSGTKPSTTTRGRIGRNYGEDDPDDAPLTPPPRKKTSMIKKSPSSNNESSTAKQLESVKSPRSSRIPKPPLEYATSLPPPPPPKPRTTEETKSIQKEDDFITKQREDLQQQPNLEKKRIQRPHLEYAKSVPERKIIKKPQLEYAKSLPAPPPKVRTEERIRLEKEDSEKARALKRDAQFSKELLQHPDTLPLDPPTMLYKNNPNNRKKNPSEEDKSIAAANNDDVHDDHDENPKVTEDLLLPDTTPLPIPSMLYSPAKNVSDEKTHTSKSNLKSSTSEAQQCPDTFFPIVPPSTNGPSTEDCENGPGDTAALANAKLPMPLAKQQLDQGNDDDDSLADVILPTTALTRNTNREVSTPGAYRIRGLDWDGNESVDEHIDEEVVRDQEATGDPDQSEPMDAICEESPVHNHTDKSKPPRCKRRPCLLVILATTLLIMAVTIIVPVVLLVTPNDEASETNSNIDAPTKDQIVMFCNQEYDTRNTEFILIENCQESLPTQIGLLTSLKTLKLLKNKFSNKVPPEIGALTNLEEFVLDENDLTGNIPTSIGVLTNLQIINFQNNQLTGSIISEIGMLTNLHSINFQNNQLTSDIPSVIGMLTNLHSIDFRNNQLTGDIPSEIGLLTSLTFLDMMLNYFTLIPSEIGMIRELEFLFLNDNNKKLKGTIPSEIGMLQKLERLNLGGNRLTGSIPTEIGMLVNLRNLELLYNEIGGTIPSEIGFLSNMEQLNLSNNDLNGDVPSEIGLLKDMKCLNLRSNDNLGTIPSEITRLTFLREGVNYFYRHRSLINQQCRA